MTLINNIAVSRCLLALHQWNRQGNPNEKGVRIMIDLMNGALISGRWSTLCMRRYFDPYSHGLSQ